MSTTRALAARIEEQDADAEFWLEDARNEPPDPAACRELWVAVLGDALMLSRYKPRGWEQREGRNTATERRMAYAWLTDDGDDVGSFRWVCGMLDLDADAVQERVFRKLAS